MRAFAFLAAIAAPACALMPKKPIIAFNLNYSAVPQTTGIGIRELLSSDSNRQTESSESDAYWKAAVQAQTQFIYIHIPKVAGESLIQAASDGNVPTCTSGTALETLHLRDGWMCSCESQCAYNSSLAIREEHFENIHMENIWQAPVWVALVRDPESWFYSAVGQFCAGMGRDTLPCKSDPVDLQTLLETGWFNPKMKGDLPVKYYFHGNDLQLQMLGNIWEQHTYLICTLENRNMLLHTMSKMTRGRIELNANVRVNVAHWPHIDKFRQNIPWEQVKGHYTNDIELYNMVRMAGCIGSENIESIIEGVHHRILSD